MTEIRCGECRYWLATTEEVGDCHRYAPRPLEADSQAYWPTTLDDDWCGEFALKPPSARMAAERSGQVVMRPTVLP